MLKHEVVTKLYFIQEYSKKKDENNENTFRGLRLMRSIRKEMELCPVLSHKLFTRLKVFIPKAACLESTRHTVLTAG